MKTWITADWHLGENRFELMGRPFVTVDQMINTLVDNHNNYVSPEDIVIVNGDVCYQKTKEFLPQVDRFNGRKILIRGNHDRVFTNKELSLYFEEIIEEGSGIDRMVGDISCYITHYPTEGVKYKFNLVGHIHSAWKYQLNMMNVGVDVHHFRPINLDSIKFHFDAITKFYDADVWVGYRDINFDWKDKRGKSNTYFRP